MTTMFCANVVLFFFGEQLIIVQAMYTGENFYEITTAIWNIV